MQAPKELYQSKEQELLEECGAGLIGHGLEADYTYDGLLVQALDLIYNGRSFTMGASVEEEVQMRRGEVAQLKKMIKLLRTLYPEAAAAVCGGRAGSAEGACD